jgi:cysteine desulfurase / selenocysteine lyase
MGFERVEKYLDEFPIRSRLIYMNHAAVAPLSRRAAAAMTQLADDVRDFGTLHYEQWLETYQAVRTLAARLINCRPAEIAIVKNTSEGISFVANGIRWGPNDRIVAFREEFPANVYPWRKVAERGVAVDWLSVFDPLEKIEQAVRGARLLAISFVQYLSGYRAPIQEIGEICRRNRCIYFVDAIQGLGAFPLDIEKCQIDALAADGHKWLLGPEGCGVLYVSENLQDSLEPVEFGWTNVANYNDYSSPDLALRPDAGRYESGTLNTIGCYGLRAALELILEVGVREIAPVVQNLGDRIAAGVQAKGYEVLGCRTPASGAGIVSFRKAGTESGAIVRRLRAENIIAASRQGWVRTSPHFYVSPDDIDRLLDSLQ